MSQKPLRNTATALFFAKVQHILPPSAEVEPESIRQNGEFEAAHCRPPFCYPVNSSDGSKGGHSVSL